MHHFRRVALGRLSWMIAFGALAFMACGRATEPHPSTDDDAGSGPVFGGGRAGSGIAGRTSSNGGAQHTGETSSGGRSTAGGPSSDDSSNSGAPSSGATNGDESSAGAAGTIAGASSTSAGSANGGMSGAAIGGGAPVGGGGASAGAGTGGSGDVACFDGGGGSGGAGGACSAGDPLCGAWQKCELEFFNVGGAWSAPKTHCSCGHPVSAFSLNSQNLSGVSARFELVTSPGENILFAGAAYSSGATLSGVTPGLILAGGWGFQGTNTSQVQPKFLRSGPKGRTFMVGTTDGNLFDLDGVTGDQDVFAWAAKSDDLYAEWTTQLGGPEPDSAQGAAATPDGGLAVVGTFGAPELVDSQRLLWLWDQNATLSTRVLTFPDDTALARGLDVDSAGNLYLVTSPPTTTLLKLSKTGDELSSTPTNAATECTDCQNLAASPSGAVYLVGTAPAAGDKLERRLSRRGPSGTVDWFVRVRDDLKVAALIANGEHVIAVGTIVEPGYTGLGLLFELDQTGALVRQILFATNVTILSASLADTGRVDVILRSSFMGPSQTFLVQVNP